jgi:hypothetical protein
MGALSMSAATFSQTKPSIRDVRDKIGWLCQLIRWLIVGWIAWNFYLNFEPLLKPAITAAQWNAHWGFDLKCRGNAICDMVEPVITVSDVYANRAVLFVTWAAAAILAMAVWQLMSHYLVGEILTVKAARALRMVGITGMIAALADVAVRPPMVAVLSTDIFRYYKWSDWVGPYDLLYVMIALITIALAHIQGTAAAISDEHQQFV